MDWLAFISGVIGHLAWPLVVILLAFKFQSEVRRLLNRIKRMKGPAGTEAEFADELQEVSVEVEKKAITEGALNDPLSVELWQQAAKDAGMELNLGHAKDLETNPGLVVLRSYGSVEQAMSFLIKEAKLAPASAPSDTPGFYAFTLMEAGFIDRQTMELIHRLRKLRDQLWHIEPDRKTATEYYFTTRKVLQILFRELHRMRTKRSMQDG